MLLNCGVGEDSRVPWTAKRSNQSTLKDISPELEGLTLKRKLQYIGHLIRRIDSSEKTLMLGKIKGGRRGRQDEMVALASPTQCTWVWVNCRSWWWTGRPGVLQSMGSQRVGHDWATELNWMLYMFQKWEGKMAPNYWNPCILETSGHLLPLCRLQATPVLWNTTIPLKRLS